MKSSTIIKSAVAAGALAVAGVTSVSADTINVKAGDTLTKLAAEHGTTVAELAQKNGIENTNLIFIGQQLNTQVSTKAPSQEATTSKKSAAGTYAVKAGDTLYRIAANNGVSVAELATANSIQNINYISVGQVLNFAANATPAPAASTPAPAASTPAPAASTPAPAASTPAPAASTPAPAASTPAPAASTPAPAASTPAPAASTPAPAASTPAPAASTPAPAASTPAPVAPTPAPVAPTPAPVAPTPAADSAAQTLVNSLNAKRASLGLAPVSLDAGLSARAQSRAQNAVANGGLPTNHFATNDEVVAIGWSTGAVIDAWYNETNMITTGTPGHRMWVANARATSVGFGIVGDTIVAESNVGQY
ncbi:LysM peptidoglycan-binding domain-containing protein [Leuconostoc gasicomitatum]|uniref:LysM peptidoglycan-binding domain-containing protein n=1 Tax=Leuconostoc gasicomitatum TaxID=115778 RepID=UPI0015CBE15B|nr:CAP domain-containing protein [Leuconostoc gasicomitatum]QLG78495.1 LysM peptidoglycan-binding domain-containing protein [Leuconostoc gasicomitatum]